MSTRENAAALIELHGWLQGAEFSHQDGYSIVGAIQAFLSYNPHLSSQKSKALEAELTAQAGITTSLQEWNDGESRTKEEVLHLLRGTIVTQQTMKFA